MWRLSGNVERLRHIQEVYIYRGGKIMVLDGIMLVVDPYLFVQIASQQPSSTSITFLNRSFVHLLGWLGKTLTVLWQTGWSPRKLIYCRNQHNSLTRFLSRMYGTCFKQSHHIWAKFTMNMLFPGSSDRITSNLPQVYIDKIIFGMNGRCRAIINQRGDHTL